LVSEYLPYTKQEIGYYAALNMQVLGYEPPHVMLLHANRLNAYVIEPLLALFTDGNHKFVSLATAQSDAAYRPATEEYITKEFGATAASMDTQYNKSTRHLTGSR